MIINVSASPQDQYSAANVDASRNELYNGACIIMWYESCRQWHKIGFFLSCCLLREIFMPIPACSSTSENFMPSLPYCSYNKGGLYASDVGISQQLAMLKATAILPLLKELWSCSTNPYNLVRSQSVQQTVYFSYLKLEELEYSR